MWNKKCSVPLKWINLEFWKDCFISTNLQKHRLKMFSCSQSREHCQSRFFKEWHPDYIAAYNSLGDPHLRHYFAHPARKNHLSRNHQVIQGFSSLPILPSFYPKTCDGVANYFKQIISIDPRWWTCRQWAWMATTKYGMGAKKARSRCGCWEVYQKSGWWKKGQNGIEAANEGKRL